MTIIFLAIFIFHYHRIIAVHNLYTELTKEQPSYTSTTKYGGTKVTVREIN